MKRNVGVGEIRKDLREGESQGTDGLERAEVLENEQWDELPWVAEAFKDTESDSQC